MRLKHILLASAVLVSVASFAQKDELKKLKKIYDKDVPTAADLADYKANLEKLAPLATEEGDKIYYNFYRVNAPNVELATAGTPPTPAQFAKFFTPNAIKDLASAYNAVLEYEKKTGKKVFTDDINQDVATFKPLLVNTAISLGEAKKNKEASDILYAIYLLDKKDQEKLYYAASYALNAQDYTNALAYYNELKDLNYTGDSTVYFAKNKATGKEETFPTKQERELFIKAGTHEKPRDEKMPSKKGEIMKFITLILVETGKVDEAKASIAEARKANPDDVQLILAEADMYLKVKDFDNYTKAVNEALAKKPNDVDLLFNLGVVSTSANKLEDAEKYYKQALAINPNYLGANLNLAELKLRVDEKYVSEMNKLGTSEKDNKRYDFLKAERAKNFTAVLPYLEKAYEIQPDEDVKKLLINVYNVLEMTDKKNALKAKQ